MLTHLREDDVATLRPQALEKLGKIGRVVFGLTPEEVGHVSPQWTPRTEQEVQEKARELEKKLGYTQQKTLSAATASVDFVGDVTSVRTFALALFLLCFGL